MGLNVRPYTAADFAAVASIYAHAKLDEFNGEQARFTLLPLEEDAERLAAFARCTVLVCESDDIVAGFAAFSGNTLRALFVHPARRGKGIGASLLDAVLGMLPGPVRLSVARSNLVALALYRNAGFTATGDFATSYNGTAVTYTAMLRPAPDGKTGDSPLF